jgi:hypothetical protein
VDVASQRNEVDRLVFDSRELVVRVHQRERLRDAAVVVIEGDALLRHQTAAEPIRALPALLDEIDLWMTLRRRAALVRALELPVPGPLHLHEQGIQQPL